MATEKATQDTPPEADDSDSALDSAIDDLRGVLKKDAGGLGDGLPESISSAGATLAGDDPFAEFQSAGAAAPGDDFPPAPEDDPFGAPELGDTSEQSIPAGGGFESSSFETGGTSPAAGQSGEPRMDLIMDIPIDVEIILGRSRMPVSSLLSLSEGSTVGLDRRIGEPVEIVANGRLIGRGEITVLEDDETRFGVRLTEVLSSKS